jgi:hypothetical protein
MAQYFSLHPEQPQARLIRQAAEIIRAGGLVALPTDSAYALACHVGDAALLERIRRIRGVDERHHFTLMCRDLSEIGTYALVDNASTACSRRPRRAATPSSCAAPRRCRAACCIPSARPSACACPTTPPPGAAGRARRAHAHLDPDPARGRAPLSTLSRSATAWSTNSTSSSRPALRPEPTTVIDLSGSAPASRDARRTRWVCSWNSRPGLAGRGGSAKIARLTPRADQLQTLAIYALPVLFAITLHEAAHGYVARHFGDMTAYLAGRISLNPLRHVDLVGTIAVPRCHTAEQASGGKRHPVRLGQAGAGELLALRHPKAAHGCGWPRPDRAPTCSWRSAGRCCSSMATGCFRSANPCDGAHGRTPGSQINLVLMALNLLPIPPLDGGRIARQPAAASAGLAVRTPGALGPADPARAAGHQCTRHAVLWPLMPCSSARCSPVCPTLPQATEPCMNESSPACAPPGACTSATTTACSRTGSSCRTSIPACSSSPTGMR